MRGETDSLIADCMLIKELKTLQDLREYSNIITKGEEISSVLLALALLKESSPSISLNSNQLEMKGKKLTNILLHGEIISVNRYPRVEPVVLYASRLQLNFQLT